MSETGPKRTLCPAEVLRRGEEGRERGEREALLSCEVGLVLREVKCEHLWKYFSTQGPNVVYLERPGPRVPSSSLSVQAARSRPPLLICEAPALPAPPPSSLVCTQVLTFLPGRPALGDPTTLQSLLAKPQPQVNLKAPTCQGYILRVDSGFSGGLEILQDLAPSPWALAQPAWQLCLPHGPPGRSCHRRMWGPLPGRFTQAASPTSPMLLSGLSVHLRLTVCLPPGFSEHTS